MVIVKLNSGLGNQLFQYAFGRRLAYELNVPLKLDISWFIQNSSRKYYLKYFNIIENFASKNEIDTIKQTSYLKEQNHQFMPNFLNVPPNVYVEGYWQSEKYFKAIEEIIRKEFSLRYHQNEANQKMAEKIKDCQAVSLHIRRGDYLYSPQHYVCSIDYYYKAVNQITANLQSPHFFIFSDDWQWVQTNFKLSYPVTYVTLNNEEHCYEDLRLISLCKYHITANSTFSWWGSWLSDNPNKVVITPKHWLKNDYLFPEWYNHLLPLTWYKL